MKYCRLIFIILLISGCNTTRESVLFSSDRNGSSDIYLMDSKGRILKQLTSGDREEWAPVWIGDKEIAFLRQSGDTIARVGLNLTTGEEFDLEHPATCILDDKNILYARNGRHQLFSCHKNIFLYDPDTDNLVNLTRDLAGTSAYPGWGADDNKVLFTSNHTGTNQIFQISLPSNQLTQLTDMDANNERGDLSPDGKWLVFSSDYYEKGNQDILLKHLPSGRISIITESKGTELIARFSGNGKTIYYGSNKDGNWEIYAYDTRAKRTRRLTTNEAFDGDPRVLK